MEHPKTVIHRILYRLQRHFAENRATRIQTALLALFFCLLAWIAGVLGGSVAAFFVYTLTPDGPTRDWPAVLTFAAVTTLFGAFGIAKSLQMYRNRISDSPDS
jgi:Flp pilus assembly protein protease CpaA